MKNKDISKPDAISNQADLLVRCGDPIQVKFETDNGEIAMKLVDGKIRVYCDGILLVIPWSTNSIRLSVNSI